MEEVVAPLGSPEGCTGQAYSAAGRQLAMPHAAATADLSTRFAHCPAPTPPPVKSTDHKQMLQPFRSERSKLRCEPFTYDW